jgi:hypothetical protein
MPQITKEGLAKFAKEKCYYGDTSDPDGIYPACCPQFQKVCKGHKRYDPSKVPRMP